MAGIRSAKGETLWRGKRRASQLPRGADLKRQQAGAVPSARCVRLAFRECSRHTVHDTKNSTTRPVLPLCAALAHVTGQSAGHVLGLFGRGGKRSRRAQVRRLRAANGPPSPLWSRRIGRRRHSTTRRRGRWCRHTRWGRHGWCAAGSGRHRLRRHRLAGQRGHRHRVHIRAARA